MTKVLVIKDDLDIRELLVKILGDEGFEVAAAENGRTGIQMARRNPPEIIVCDIMMPALDGYGVLKALQAEEQTATIPFIFLTALADQQNLRLGMRLGADDYLVKPIDIDEFLAAIRTRLAKSQLVQKWRSGLDLPRPTQAVADDTQPMDAGRTIGNYRLLQVIGEGAWGIVFLCENRSDRRRHALKILKINLMEEITRESIIRRFVNEANAVSQLKHPNIVNFIEFGYSGVGDVQSPYFVMEYFPGLSLSRQLETGIAWDYRQKVSVILQVACALAAVHARNIVHRDIKPGNILVDENFNVKITDFGVCHLPCSDLTITSHILGTPCYLSPEYLATGIADQLADIYSLGVVAYELFLGMRPFDSENISCLMDMIQKELPPEPRKLKPDFPPTLQKILAKMLKKKPSRRYQDIAELVDDLVLFEKSTKSSNGLMGKMARRLVDGRDWK